MLAPVRRHDGASSVAAAHQSGVAAILPVVGIDGNLQPKGIAPRMMPVRRLLGGLPIAPMEERARASRAGILPFVRGGQPKALCFSKAPT